MRPYLLALAAALLLPSGVAAAAHGDRVAVPPPGTDPLRWTSSGYPRSWTPGDPASTPPRTTRGPVWAASPTCAPVAVAPTPTAAQVACAFPRWSVWGSYRPVTVSGSMLITRGGRPGSGTEADLDDTLGIDSGSAIEFGAAWAPFPSLGRHRVFLAFERFCAEEEQVLPSSVVYRDVLFPAGVRVASKVELEIAKAGYEALLHDDRSASLRAGIAGWLWRFQGTMQDEAGTRDQSRSFRHVLPVAHVAGEVRSGNWFAAGAVAGGWIGDRRWALDLSASVGVRAFSRARFEVGYRWTRFVFDETTNEGDFVFHGPFVGASIDF